MISGRPLAGEFADYAQTDINYVSGDDIVSTLEQQLLETLSLLRAVPEDIAASLTYAPGKWNLKQVVGHLADDERIFAYRALCIARNDRRPLAGFDEKAYVQFAGFEQRSFDDLLQELTIVRHASLALFRGLSNEAWMRRSMVNGYSATVRGLAFHIAGHELRHLRTIRERYLPAMHG
jgi:DinB superfamily